MQLRVAFLTFGFGKDNLGLGRSSWHLVNELRKLGVNVDVFTTQHHMKTFGAPLFYLKNAFLSLGKYDIVHSNEGAGLLVTHPHMIETYHHDYKQTSDINSLLFHNLENFQCRKAKHIIVPSFKTKESVLRYGFPEHKISVIYHGVDEAFIKYVPRRRSFLRRKYGVSDSFVVINVGQMIPRKNQLELVKLLSGMSNVVLIIVGDGPEKTRVKMLAEEMSVRLLHFECITDAQLIDLYNISDVYVHTSFLEGFGLTITEALACGLPVIAYNVADFKNLINNSGFVLPKGDTIGMKKTIQNIKDNSELRESLSESVNRASKKFTWTKAAHEHLKLYLKVKNL
ncbi:MAG: glycosyltransferase family 4 protein [Patescibacteria group bacterium]|jgi:glycosyltransferase involved in cell wall biosynthesis